MEDNNIKSLWKKSDKQAGAYYGKIEDELIKKASKESQSLFARIKRNIIIELWVSVILAIALPFIFWKDKMEFAIVAVLVVALLAVTFYYYLRYLNQIKTVNEPNVLEALKIKEKILSAYVKRLYLLFYIAVPVGFFIGLAFGDQVFVFFSLKTLIQVAVATPLLILVFWLGRKYIYALYTKHLIHLREIIAGVENG